MPKYSQKQLVLALAGASLGMLMLAFAAVPLYRIFCEVTGFGGTTKRAAPYTKPAVNRAITVLFNTDTDPNLPWKFEAVERHISLKLGENRLVAFRATNLTNQPTRGTATFNVTPNAAGKYFNKVECFCFAEQRLAANQSATLPVSFFIDPAILDDPETRDLTNITLSYTFFSYESANHSKITQP